MNRSFKLGLALGLSGKPIQLAPPQESPIGFFYGQLAKDGEVPTHTINGVDYVGAILPKLPPYGKDPYSEWDNERFPCATIIDWDELGLWFMPFSVEPSYNSVEDFLSFLPQTEFKLYQYLHNSWDAGEEGIAESGTKEEMPLPIWANFDIFDENGNKVIEKFKPIPVYE